MHEYGQSWSIASALLDGPRTFEQIKDYYRIMARRVGMFADPFTLGVENGNKPERFIADALEELENLGWVCRDGEFFSLTDKGKSEAHTMLSEIEQGRERIDTITEPKRVSLVTLVVHFALAALKLPAALISGSVGLLNDSLDTLADGNHCGRFCFCRGCCVGARVRGSLVVSEVFRYT